MKVLKAFIIIAAVLGLFTCFSDPSNPWDPEMELEVPSALNFTYYGNIGYIDSENIEIKWDRSTDPNFFFYLVSRSKTPLDLQNLELTVEQQEGMITAFEEYKSEQFWNWDSAKIADNIPILNREFKAVALLPDANVNTYFDTVLEPSTRYYYTVVVFLKNLVSFSASDQIRIETPPDIGVSSFCEVIGSHGNDSQYLFDVDVDDVNLEVYVSGQADNWAQYFNSTWDPGINYFILKSDWNDAFYTYRLMYEEDAIVISGYQDNPDANLERARGICADENYNIYTANILYPTWDMVRISNQTGNIDDTTIIGSDPGPVNDYTTYMHYDKVNDEFWIVGEAIDVYNPSFVWQRGVTFTSDVYLRGIAIDSDDNIYVTESERNVVWKYDNSLNFLVGWGGFGSKAGEFDNIHDIVVDNDDNVWVADTGNHRVVKFDSDGVFLTSLNLRDIVGNYGEYPRGLFVGTDNILYIACAKGVYAIQL